MFNLKSLSIAAVALGLMAGSANAVPLSSMLWDNFDTDASALNVNTMLNNWNVTSGNIDVVDHGDFSINCAGGAGKCLDMAGTTGGTIETKDMFMVGTYKVSFDFRGNDRSTAVNDSMDLLFDTFSETFTKTQNEGYTTVMRMITVTTAGAVSFAHAGTDSAGLILDNVHIEKVPEPGTLALFGLGLAGLSFARRRKTA